MITKITEDDVSNVCDLLRILRLESPYFNRYPADEPWTVQNLTTLIRNSNMIMIKDSQNSSMRGVMFGATYCPWFSPFYEANEMLLAVFPEYRGSPAAVCLIKAFEQESVKRACRAVNVGSSLGIGDKRVEALYKRLGYVKHGLGLTKRIEDV
jgi:hypothetical protein